MINQIMKHPKAFEESFSYHLDKMTPIQRKYLFQNAYQAEKNGAKQEKSSRLTIV